MRPLNGLAIALGLGALATAGAVWGTTFHGISVDGNLSDFTSDEKTGNDSPSDSLYGVDNELTTFYVTWDAQQLYLGFDYKIEGGAVMVLLATGQAGGVDNLCPAAGYGGLFQANVQGPASDPFNLMLAFWADWTNPGTKPVPRVFRLAANSSTEITSGVSSALVESVSAGTDKRTGAVEAAIPWDTIYGLGAGKVSPHAVVKIVSVLRGQNDGDGLGDASPDPSGAVKNSVCGGADSNYLDNYFTLNVDTNGDGTPEAGWSPATNAAAPVADSGSPDAKPAVDSTPAHDVKPPDAKPAADLKPAVDKPHADAKPAADLKPAVDKPHADAKPAADLKPAVDKPKVVADTRAGDVKRTDRATGKDALASGDAELVADQRAGDGAAASVDHRSGKVDAGKKAQIESGCTCSAAAGRSDAALSLLVALLGLALLRRRRWGAGSAQQD